MCNACGFLCCGSDMFDGCGCDHCPHSGCWDIAEDDYEGDDQGSDLEFARCCPPASGPFVCEEIA